MTNSPDDARLPEAAERLLARWEQSDMHEVGAQRAGDAALERIVEGAVESRPLAGLDSPPFPQEPNEPSLSAAPSWASSPGPPSSPGKPHAPSLPSLPAPPGGPSSGRPSNPMMSRGQEDMKLLEESLALSTRARRQVALSAPPPSSVSAAAEPLRPSAAPPLRPSTASISSAPSMPPPLPSVPSTAAAAQPSLPAPGSAVMAQPASAPQGILFPPMQRQPRPGIGGLIGGVVGVTAVAAAAAAWLVLGQPRSEAARIAHTPVAPTAPSSVAAAPPASPAPAAATAQAAAAPEAKRQPATSPAAEPAAGTHRSADTAAKQSVKIASAEKGLSAGTPAAGSPTKGVPNWLKSAQGPTEKNAATTVAQESEGPSPGMKPADKGPNTDNLPTQPSHGAVQAAVNAVMPGARRCVAGGKPVKATITFRGATGKVLSVSVARGTDKSAAACVRSALNGAKLSPFAKPTFSSSTTVRP